MLIPPHTANQLAFIYKHAPDSALFKLAKRFKRFESVDVTPAQVKEIKKEYWRVWLLVQRRTQLSTS